MNFVNLICSTLILHEQGMLKSPYRANIWCWLDTGPMLASIGLVSAQCQILLVRTSDQGIHGYSTNKATVLEYHEA